MKRFLPALTLAAALAAPVTAIADMPRALSPARQMLQQMIIDEPANRSIRPHHRAAIVGEWIPQVVHTPRFGLISLPRWANTWFSIRRHGRLSFSMGCNTFWTQAQLHRGWVDLGPISGTRMACPGRRGAAERRVIRALRHADRVEARRGELRFLDHRGNALLILGDATPHRPY